MSAELSSDVTRAAEGQTSTMTGDFIQATAVERHERLMREFASGVAGMCISLWAIRQERTYTAIGKESFEDFLRSIGMGKATGRLYANAGPLLVELRKTGHDALIGHVDMLRPVALLLNPKKHSEEQQRRIVERQAQIVRTAAAVAKRGQEPLNERVISRVAESNYGIRPRAKYLADKRRTRELPLDAEKQRQKMRTDIELACSVILGYQRTGYELRQELGEATAIVGLMDALTVLDDWRNS